LLTKVTTQLKQTRTADNLHETILNAIDRALAGRPISISGPFETALRAQERIGWCSMLQGYWAQEWQAAYCHTSGIPDGETSDEKKKRLTTMARWQTSIIRVIWTSIIALWKIRNDDRHGRDATTKEVARHEVLTNELQILYDNRDQYPVGVQQLLRTSFEVHTHEKLSRIEDWLNAFRVTFRSRTLDQMDKRHHVTTIALRRRQGGSN
jgi:hypothetical protein